jgi:hypothetical protein
MPWDFSADFSRPTSSTRPIRHFRACPTTPPAKSVWTPALRRRCCPRLISTPPSPPTKTGSCACRTCWTAIPPKTSDPNWSAGTRRPVRSQYEDFMRHVSPHRPVRSQYEDFLRHVRRVQGRPHRHRHQKRVRLPDALRPERGLSAGDHQEGLPARHHRRAAVVPARRLQREMAAGAWLHHLGRMGPRRRRPRPGLRRAVAQLAQARRRPHRPDRRRHQARSRPTPTRAASS